MAFNGLTAEYSKTDNKRQKPAASLKGEVGSVNSEVKQINTFNQANNPSVLNDLDVLNDLNDPNHLKTSLVYSAPSVRRFPVLRRSAQRL